MEFNHGKRLILELAYGNAQSQRGSKELQPLNELQYKLHHESSELQEAIHFCTMKGIGVSGSWISEVADMVYYAVQIEHLTQEASWVWNFLKSVHIDEDIALQLCLLKYTVRWNVGKNLEIENNLLEAAFRLAWGERASPL